MIRSKSLPNFRTPEAIQDLCKEYKYNYDLCSDCHGEFNMTFLVQVAPGVYYCRYCSYAPCDNCGRYSTIRTEVSGNLCVTCRPFGFAKYQEEKKEDDIDLCHFCLRRRSTINIETDIVYCYNCFHVGCMVCESNDGEVISGLICEFCIKELACCKQHAPDLPMLHGLLRHSCDDGIRSNIILEGNTYNRPML